MDDKRYSVFDPSPLNGERGNTLLVFLFMLATLSALAIGALQVTTLNVESTNAHRKAKKVFYAAEVGLDLAVNDIINEFGSLSVYTTSADFGGDSEGYISQNYRSHDVKYKITNPLESYLYQTVVGNGIIYHYAHTFDVEAQSISQGDGSRETVRERIRVLETPLVQYYVFYGGSGDMADLEIHPGPLMNSWGRIHANGDIYAGSSGGFRLRNYDDSGNLSSHFIAAGGQIFSRKKSNGAAFNPTNITVKIGNPGTTDFSPTRMIPAGGIVNGNEAAQEDLFNRYVLINEQQYQTPGQAQFLRNGFYETRAENPARPGIDGVKIVGRPADGGIEVWVSRPVLTDVTTQVIAGIMPSGASNITPPVREYSGANDLCEDRQGDRFVDFTDIDLNLLGQWYDDYLTSQGLALAGDGMLVYASRSPATPIPFPNSGSRFEAIRLIRLGGSPAQLWDETTVASDNPVYIQGDFNTVNTRGAAVIADAINILSNNFTTKACNSGLTNATQTTVNAAFFAGNVPAPANGGGKSGGLANYPRFHERWAGVNSNIRGSFVNLWTSSQADGIFSVGGNRYNPPQRNWGWDVRLGNPSFWPPFIPSTFSIERTGFLE